MLKLKRYHFSGIGRFVKKQTIDLENRDHLIKVDGQNTNTGGSSGAGKSTTLEAIAYLLGISEVPSTQLQSRITKDSIWVQGEFEGDIVITRSKKDGLTIQTPEETVSGNSKLAEEKLNEIIGIKRNLLKTMCYKRQKQGGFFLNLTPKESHYFLTECLGLGVYQQKIDKLNDLIKEKYKPRKIELDSSIFELKNAIKELEEYVNQKEKPVQPLEKDLISMNFNLKVLSQKKITEKISFSSNLEKLGPKPEKDNSSCYDKENEITLLKEKIDILKKSIRENLIKKNEEEEQARQALLKIKEKIKQALSYRDFFIEEKDKENTILNNIKHIEEEKCPTCLRQWDGNGGDKLLELKSSLKKSQEKLIKYRENIEKIPHLKVLEEKSQFFLEKKKLEIINIEQEYRLGDLQDNLRVLENEKDNVENYKKQKYLEELNNWNEKVKALEDVYEQKISSLEENENKIKYEIDRHEIEQKSYKEALDSYKKDCKNIEGRIFKLKTQLDKNIKELEELKKNIILSEESVRLIKNYTLQKFQDALEYIGNRATEIINMIPNMSNAVIYFESAKVTKTGKIKNEVNAVLNLEGDSLIPVKTLSGGERTSADLAVDLAVNEMIENMTQKGVNFLIIDEGFDGLDSISKIECLEILKKLSTDKKILIIDHSTEVKEMICDTINIKRINEESFVA